MSGIRLVVEVKCYWCSDKAQGTADFSCPPTASVELPDGWEWMRTYGESDPSCPKCKAKNERHRE